MIHRVFSGAHKFPLNVSKCLFYVCLFTIPGEVHSYYLLFKEIRQRKSTVLLWSNRASCCPYLVAVPGIRYKGVMEVVIFCRAECQQKAADLPCMRPSITQFVNQKIKTNGQF